MTVSSSTNKVSFNGDGSTTVFAYSFKVFDESDLTVILRASDGTETTQTISTQYSVSGVGDAGGGNVTMVTAPASGEQLTILREQPLTQGLDLVPNDPFPANSIEESLDKLTFIDQRLNEKIDRALVFSAADIVGDATLPVKETRIGRVLAFNETTGNPQAGPEISDISTLNEITADIATLADIEDGTDATDAIQTVAGISSDVTTVSSNSSNITSVAGNSTNINSVAGNSTNINTVAGSISSVNTVATSISNVNTVATNIADVNNFTDVYRVGATDPTTSLDEGDLFYDTALNVLKYYNGTSWVTVAGYSLPTASASVLGGIKVGTGLTISAGVLSADLGGIIVEDEGSALTTAASTLNFTGNGVVASGTGSEKTITITDTDTTYSDATISVAGLMSTSDKSKLDNIEANADVTDTANVTAAGALMDSEVTNLAQVKAFDSSDYATAAQGTTADAALPKAGGTMTGAITFAAGQTFDGRDVSADGTKLDGIATSATANPNAIDNVVEDTTPQLGGNLDVNGNSIVSASAGNIAITPDTTGSIVLDGLSWPQADGNDGDALKTDGAGNLSFGTPYDLIIENASGSPTLPVINATNTGFSIAIGHLANVGANCTAGFAVQGTLTKDGITDNVASIAIGSGSSVNGGLTNTAIGPFAQSGGTNTTNDVALGKSFANGTSSTAINIINDTSTYGATGNSSIAIGNQAKASHTNSVAIGKDSVSSASNRISLGSSSQTIEISAAYRLPSSDGTANQVLQTDGSGTLTFATVGGLSDVVDDTTPQLGGNLDLNSSNITGTGDITVTGDIKPTTYQETVGTESSGTLDLSTGNVFSHAPSANTTYVFSNPPSTGTAFGFTLKVTPSATITQTWPASVDWAGGTAPTATASGETDVFTFYTQDGGTTYYGFQAGDAMA